MSNVPLQQALHAQQVAFNDFFAKRAEYPRFKEVLLVDRWFPSSRLCSALGCDHVDDKMPLHVRSWTCPSCGTVHDRNVNAAINVLAAGLAESGEVKRLRRTGETGRGAFREGADR